MRLSPEVQLPQNPDTPYARELSFQLKSIFRASISKLNAMADCRLSAIDNTGTAAPTTGTWSQGDQVRNSNPTELGTAGNKYVVTGFICVAGGAPGTWVSMRVLTGN